MSHHLSGIALPFAVLGISFLHGVYLPCGDKRFELLDAADDFCRYVLGECQVFEGEEDVLQHYLFGINRSYGTLAHKPMTFA